MINNLKLSSFFFSLTLSLGVIMVISSNNWFSIWMGLELNLYSFIPLLMNSNQNQEKEAAIKYFLIQAMGSGGLLLSMILSMNNPAMMIIMLMALLLKTGMAPMHFWFPSVMTSISWPMCMVLSTVQKIAPMFLLMSTLNSAPKLTMLISGASTLIGGIGGLNQTQLRAILAYSSIGHMGWILAASMFSISLSSLYFITYIATLIPIMIILWSAQMKTNNQTALISNSTASLPPTLMLLLLSLGGLPPLMGFFPKFLVIYSLVNLKLITLALILVLGSSINLYYYLKMMYSMYFSVLNLPKPPYTLAPNYTTIALMSFLSTTGSLIIITPWLML